MLNTRHRLVNFGLMLCLATSTATLAMMQAVPPAAHAAISWTAAPPAGSGIAPWESGTSVGAGSVSLSVDNATGNLFLQTRGQSIPGVNGFAQVFAPHYQTFARSFQTDVGYGWSTGTGRDVGLLLSTSSATFYDGSGRGWVFPKSGSTFSTPAGADAQLVQNADGTYSLTSNASGGTINFDSGGYVTSFQNRQGNAVSPIYGSNGWLMEIRNTEGQLSLVSLDSSGRVAAFSDPGGTGGGGRTTYYTYDASGNLATVKDPAGNITTLTYDSTHLLTQVTDPRGDQTQVFYTTLNGNPAVARIVRITNTSTNTGPTTTFSYTTGSTQITDPNNHTTTIAYDSSNRPTTVTNADGTASSIVWNADNHPTQTTDENQHTTSYGYDSNNNVTQVTLPNGLHSTAQYTDTTHPYEPTSVTDPQGHTSTIQYNSQGLPTTVTDALGHSSTVAYNSNGTVASSTDANGHTTTYGYTSVGLLSSIARPSPLGSSSCTYSSVNDFISNCTDGKGQGTGFSYDTAGRLASYSFAAGLTVSYTYDPNSNRTQMIDPTGTTNYTYNNLDQQTQETLPSGQAFSYSWDGVGNLLSKTDNTGTTAYGYTARNELASVTSPQSLQTNFAYDPTGNKTKVAYPNGVTEQMSYNTIGQLTRIWATNSAGTTLTSYTYGYTNPSTNQVTPLPYTETDAAGNVTTNSYDPLNRLTQAVQQNSAGTTIASYAYTFDNVGNVTSHTINGTTTAMSYNAADEQTQYGSITKTWDADGNQIGNSAGMSATYNSANETTSITPPGGSAVNMTYSDIGQGQRVSSGSANYRYDGSGLNQEVAGSTTTTYTRDLNHDFLAENVSGANYYYLTDGHGSVVGLTDGGGNLVNQYSYDPTGVPTKEVAGVQNYIGYQSMHVANVGVGGGPTPAFRRTKLARTSGKALAHLRTKQVMGNTCYFCIPGIEWGDTDGGDTSGQYVQPQAQEIMQEQHTFYNIYFATQSLQDAEVYLATTPFQGGGMVPPDELPNDPLGDPLEVGGGGACHDEFVLHRYTFHSDLTMNGCAVGDVVAILTIIGLGLAVVSPFTGPWMVLLLPLGAFAGALAAALMDESSKCAGGWARLDWLGTAGPIPPAIWADKAC